MRNQKFPLGLTVVLAMIAGNLLGGGHARGRPGNRPVQLHGRRRRKKSLHKPDL
jgi:uncharacterized integral membrane protein